MAVTAGDLLKAARPRQWIKNLLVYAAPLAAGSVLQPDVLVRSTLALVVMVLASASTYLVNDVLDRHADAAHPVKRQRPVASGRVSPRVALAAATVCAVSAVLLPLLSGVDAGLSLIVVTYLAVQALYFAWAKHQPVFDLACVASGFVLRAVAGGVASGIAISSWFLTVTASVALFVVAGKRYSELVSQGSALRASLALYSRGYLRFIWGVCAAVAIVFYALWASELSQAASGLFARLSTIPFSLLLLRYARDIDDAQAEAPETVVLGDPAFLVLAGIWVGLFLLQALT